MSMTVEHKEPRSGDARRALVLHDRPLVVDLIELTLNHGLFVVRAAQTLAEADHLLAYGSKGAVEALGGPVRGARARRMTDRHDHRRRGPQTGERPARPRRPDVCGSRRCGEIGSDGLTCTQFRGATVEKGITMQTELARLVDR